MTCHGLPFSCQYSRRRRSRAGEPAAGSWPCSPEPSAPSTWAAGSVDARIAGDHHSPSVVGTSTAALGALDTFEAAGTPGAFVAYVQARDATADTVAVEMQLDPAALRAAWAKADLAHQEAMLAALTQLGVAYRGYKADPGVGFDCSGLTSWAWARAGVQIAHQSSAQISAARRVDESAAVAGDIVQYPGHVMLYLGVDRAIVHAFEPVDRRRALASCPAPSASATPRADPRSADSSTVR